MQQTDFCIRSNLKELSRITTYCMNPLLFHNLVISWRKVEKRDSFLFPSVCKTFWNTAMISARHSELKIRTFALTRRSLSAIERSDYCHYLPTFAPITRFQVVKYSANISVIAQYLGSALNILTQCISGPGAIPFFRVSWLPPFLSG